MTGRNGVSSNWLEGQNGAERGLPGNREAKQLERADFGGQRLVALYAVG
jgi:hypothetical protein